MPGTNPLYSAYPDEHAAWETMDAAEERLEKFLADKPDFEAQIGGSVYFMQGGRLMCAPACVDGTADRENACHRSEYEGMGVEDMNQVTKAIEDWLASKA